MFLDSLYIMLFTWMFSHLYEDNLTISCLLMFCLTKKLQKTEDKKKKSIALKATTKEEEEFEEEK